MNPLTGAKDFEAFLAAVVVLWPLPCIIRAENALFTTSQIAQTTLCPMRPGNSP